jgi:uncharacterized damage-inducible protein DinB
MTTTTDAFIDAFQRIQQIVHSTVDGLDDEQLSYNIDGSSNTIAWLVWHLTRVQDGHVSELAETEEAWTSEGWFDRFALPFDRSATGYGQSAEDVSAVRGVSADDLIGYHDAVCARTIAFVETLGDDDFGVVVDTSWDPPVTLSARLVSVISDDLQHAGQASFVRGVALRR